MSGDSGAEVVHECPRVGEDLTPCCGRPPFELPGVARMTTIEDAITCPGRLHLTPTPDTTALDRVRRYLDAREFIGDDITIGHSDVGPTVTFGDIRTLLQMASQVDS